MTTTKITLTNSQVNSGTAINLLAEEVTTNWDVFTSAQDKPRQTTATSINNSISRGFNTGFANPTHTVQGVYNIEATHKTGATAEIDFEYILDLLLNSHIVMTLTADKFKTSSDSTGQRNVMLQSYSDNNSNTNVVEYTMQFIEVRSD